MAIAGLDSILIGRARAIEMAKIRRKETPLPPARVNLHPVEERLRHGRVHSQQRRAVGIVIVSRCLWNGKLQFFSIKIRFWSRFTSEKDICGLSSKASISSGERDPSDGVRHLGVIGM